MGRVVITNGCFDVLHAGHVNLLLECRHLAGERGIVIVLIDDDTKVKKDKGNDRPIFKIHERMNQVRSLRYGNKLIVDEVRVFFSDEDLSHLIKIYKPDILVKGSDWKGKVIIGGEHAKEVVFFDYIDGYSSTSIIERIKKGPEWRALNRK